MMRSIAALAMIAALYAAAPHAAAQEGAVMRVVAPVDEVDSSVDDVPVEIVVDNVENLGAFLFVMTFDADVLSYKSIERGAFIGSTGRDVQCGEPTVEPGAIRLSCVTLRLDPPGPDGSGSLATIHFEPRDSGTTPLTLSPSVSKLLTPAADPIEATLVDGTLTVNGDSGGTLTLILIIAGIVVAAVVVAGGGFAFIRSRSASRPMA
jgi:hypothetical protein